jgi:hypothetical protein
MTGYVFLVGLFHSQLQAGLSRRFRCHPEHHPEHISPGAHHLESHHLEPHFFAGLTSSQAASGSPCRTRRSSSKNDSTSVRAKKSAPGAASSNVVISAWNRNFRGVGHSSLGLFSGISRDGCPLAPSKRNLVIGDVAVARLRGRVGPAARLPFPVRGQCAVTRRALS